MKNETMGEKEYDYDRVTESEKKSDLHKTKTLRVKGRIYSELWGDALLPMSNSSSPSPSGKPSTD